MGLRPSNMFSVQSLSGGAALWLPNPDTESATNTIATMVNSARNASAVVTAQKIGRDQEKTQMKWSYLEKDIWEQMLRFWDANFYFRFTYYSRVRGNRISRVFYIGDRNDRPFAIDSAGLPTAYRDCTANVIDTGEGA